MSRDLSGPARKTNGLAGQTSPYLLQHQHNPVDWSPWGPEALERARREDKPIFLSIGYAACHWCHVMERESFESEAIAAFLNENFVSIKVDREERPDLDEIYMSAVQAITGRGGWPLTVFLTPDLEPFYGGTYFPPEDRAGMPGFLTVLRHVALAWRDRREDVAASAASLTAHLRETTRALPSRGETALPGRAETAAAAADLAGRFDPTWGGFGGAPKFPPHGALALLLREHAREGSAAPLLMARTTLDRMAGGGMYDHVGGGFARYSVDARWLVPHFEKMLYDQALLVPVYVDAWLETGAPLYRRVVEDTLDFVRRELTDPSGGFWSSLDADSDGHEGSYYVWTPDEVNGVLGPTDGPFFCEVYGIDAEGNFEGKSIPNLLGGSLAEIASRSGTREEALADTIASLRSRMLEARGRRNRPSTDDKVLTAWNGLTITAFARAYQALGRPEDLESAQRAASFVREELVGDDGRLFAVWRRGAARLNAYLDDHVFLARGLIDLYESDFDSRHLDESARIMRIVLDRFGDADGGLHFTSDDHETLLTRTRSVWDGALPAGSGVAAEVLSRLAVHTGDSAFRDAAETTLRSLGPTVRRAPSAFAALLAAVDFREGPTPEIAVVGERADPRTVALVAAARRIYVPSRALASGRPGSDEPLLKGKTQRNGAATAYVCRNTACDAPVTDPEALRAQIERLRRR